MSRNGAAAIEEDIRHTRARMDSTLDALKTKLSPGELLDHTLGYLKESGLEAGESLSRRVRDNPLPLGLMALSFAWLMMSEHRPPRRSGDGADRWRADAFEAGRPDEFSPGYARTGFREEPYRESDELDAHDYEAMEHHDRLHRAIGGVKRRADETAEAFGERLYQAKAAALDLRREAAEDIDAFMGRVDGAFHGLTDRAAEARRKLASRTARLRARAAHAAEDAAGAVKHGAERAEQFFDERPLVVGAVGVALGALVGSMLPHTRAEDRRLGGMGAQARGMSAAMARDVAAEAQDAVGRVAERTMQAAREEGLTPHEAAAKARDVGERVQHVGEAAIEAGRDEARRSLKDAGGDE